MASKWRLPQPGPQAAGGCAYLRLHLPTKNEAVHNLDGPLGGYVMHSNKLVPCSFTPVKSTIPPRRLKFEFTFRKLGR